MENNVCIIPARGGSKGIPKKNLIPFCGKPLIVWTIQQALSDQSLTDVYVSSEDSEILEVSQGAGAKIIQRPPELSTDTATSESALLHALDVIEKKYQVDKLVFLQATSPLRLEGDITNAISYFEAEKADALFSGSCLQDFCVWRKVEGELKCETYDYKNRGTRQMRKPYYIENGSIYISKPEVLRKENNRFGGKIVTFEMPTWQAFEIDEPHDIEICEFFMRTKVLNVSLQELMTK